VQHQDRTGTGPRRGGGHLVEGHVAPPGHGDDGLGRHRVGDPGEGARFELGGGHPGGPGAGHQAVELRVDVTTGLDEEVLQNGAGVEGGGHGVRPLHEEGPLAGAISPAAGQSPHPLDAGVAGRQRGQGR